MIYNRILIFLFTSLLLLFGCTSESEVGKQTSQPEPEPASPENNSQDQEITSDDLPPEDELYGASDEEIFKVSLEITLDTSTPEAQEQVCSVWELSEDDPELRQILLDTIESGYVEGHFYPEIADEVISDFCGL